MNIKRVFWILFLLNLLNYIDRQVLYAVFPLLQADLSLTDGQLGMLASVFMLVYMAYAPVVGYFAARTPRRYWIGGSALLWSMATLACATVKNYAALLTARGVLGAGEAGFTTLAQPFLAEQYPQKKRATILALFSLALPVGAALGYVLGGILGAQIGWRAAFGWVGVPGIFLGWLAIRFLREPAGRTQVSSKPDWRSYKQFLHNKPFIWICLAHAMITFMMGGFSAWMPTYFTRYLGFNVQQAGFIFGCCVVMSGAVGTYLGGKWADALLTNHRDAYFRVMRFGIWGALLTGIAGLFAPATWISVLCIGLAVAFLFLPLGPVAAALVAVTQAEVRAMAFAINIFVIHLLGDALSPVLIGQWSVQWGLKTAMALALVAAIPGLVFVQFACRTNEVVFLESVPLMQK